MGNLRLTLACGDYDLTRALIDGSVQPAGIDLTVLTMPSPERHWRMMRFEEFDVAELSMSDYLVARGSGRGFTAIPVFPHRRFRHGFIFCATDGPVATPHDLNGKRVGLRTFQTTAGVWLRGILADDYGVDLSSIVWLAQDEEALPWEPPPSLRVERVPEGTDVERMLFAGQLDAVMYPEVLSSVAKGDPRVRRLFESPKEVERDYFQRTGIFPIMHTVVINESVLAAHPWVAANVLEAFRESKDRAFAAIRNPRAISLAWVQEALEEQERVLGRDPWAYGFAANRVALETLIRYAHEQGLIARPLSAESLFYPTTLEELPRYV